MSPRDDAGVKKRGGSRCAPRFADGSLAFPVIPGFSQALQTPRQYSGRIDPLLYVRHHDLLDQFTDVFAIALRDDGQLRVPVRAQLCADVFAVEHRQAQ
jgi:hypothetical protein